MATRKRRKPPRTAPSRGERGPAPKATGGGRGAGRRSVDTGREPAAAVRESPGAAHVPGATVALVTAATFAAALSVYLLTLAPSVTFEDSGELIAAAYNLGVPHEPGYPLWTMIAKLFTLLPLGSVAYRVNLMSAVFTALGAACVALATLIVAVTWLERRSLWLAAAAAIAAGVLCATAFTTWQQSIVAEVYGLNTAFVGLLVLLVVLWTGSSSPTRRTRFFYAICLTLGLALSNHTTSILLIPVVAVQAFVVDRRLRPSLVTLLKGIGFFALGLLPYLYLPLASRRDPALDWGDPETATTFWRTVTRHQYGGLGERSGLDSTLHQLWACADLVWQQWTPVFLAFAVAGAALLWRRQRRLFWFGLVFLIATAPVTTLITDFDLSTGVPAVDADNRALQSVFYIPSYLALALLAGLGLWWAAVLLAGALDGRRAGGEAAASPPAPPRRASFAWPVVSVAMAVVALPLGLSWFNGRELTMRDYRYPQAYAANLWSVASPRSLVFVNRDQFGFPLFYYQLVEGQRTDVLVIDQELLRRSWYILYLRDHRPELMAAILPQVEGFLAAVRPFEQGDPYDGAVIDAAYVAMINAFVDFYERAGRDVYFTYTPQQGIAADYRGEPLVAAFRVRKDIAREGLTPLELGRFDFAGLTGGGAPLDRNVLMIREFYGTQLGLRATALDQTGEKAQAAECSALAEAFLRQP